MMKLGKNSLAKKKKFYLDVIVIFAITGVATKFGSFNKKIDTFDYDEQGS